jgi:hypothetical protein
VPYLDPIVLVHIVDPIPTLIGLATLRAGWVRGRSARAGVRQELGGHVAGAGQALGRHAGQARARQGGSRAWGTARGRAKRLQCSLWQQILTRAASSSSCAASAWQPTTAYRHWNRVER